MTLNFFSPKLNILMSQGTPNWVVIILLVLYGVILIGVFKYILWDFIIYPMIEDKIFEYKKRKNRKNRK